MAWGLTSSVGARHFSKGRTLVLVGMKYSMAQRCPERWTMFDRCRQLHHRQMAYSEISFALGLRMDFALRRTDWEKHCSMSQRGLRRVACRLRGSELVMVYCPRRRDQCLQLPSFGQHRTANLGRPQMYFRHHHRIKLPLEALILLRQKERRQYRMCFRRDFRRERANPPTLSTRLRTDFFLVPPSLFLNMSLNNK